VPSVSAARCPRRPHTRLDDLLLVGVPRAVLATTLRVLGPVAGLLGGLGLDLGAGGLQPGHPLLPPVQLGRQVGGLAVDTELGVLAASTASASANSPATVASNSATSASSCSCLATSR
jgi:hypothetical protein